MIGIGIGLPFIKASGIDPQAQTHFNRVITDGGTIPAGLVGCNAWFVAVKGVYGTSDITTAISSGIHPHYLGYKAGSGSGASSGLAAQTCYNAIGSIGDVIQTTAASQPLILPHTGTNYVFLPRVVGNYFSSPYNGSIALRDDFDIKAEIQPNLSGASQVIFGNSSTILNTTIKLSFNINSNNGLRLQTSFNNSVSLIYDSTANIPSITTRQWVRVTRVRSTGVIRFFTSLDGVTWTQLGTNVSGTTVQLPNDTSVYEVGSVGVGTSTNLFQGIIYRVLVSQTIDGAAALDFNPANYSRATSQSSWTSTTGEVWTNNMLATNTGFKSMICDTTLFAGNGTSVGMRAASLNMNQAAATSYTVWRKYTNIGAAQIITELGANSASSSGKGFATGFILNQEEIGIYGNVGQYNSRFTSTSLDLKLSTAINNIANANESLPYLINNVSQSFAASDATNNNTGNMNATGYNFFARNNAASLWSNVVMACDIVSKQEDDNTQRTAMYNNLDVFLNNAL
jgi:hypothetical protein